MNWNDFLRKIGSRKFWSMVAGFVTSILTAAGAGDSEIVKIVAIITAFGSIAVYMISEAYVDGKAAQGDTFEITPVDDYDDILQ